MLLDSWWDNQKDRSAERSAIRRLQVEFIENRRRLVENRESQEESLAAMRQLLSMAGPDRGCTVDISTIAPLLVSCLINATFDPRLGTLNSLISSGGLNLDEDERHAKHADRMAVGCPEPGRMAED
jgi:hypothetical protein